MISLIIYYLNFLCVYVSFLLNPEQNKLIKIIQLDYKEQTKSGCFLLPVGSKAYAMVYDHI